MITNDKIDEFEKRFQEMRQLYRMLPDDGDNRLRVEKDIASIGMEVFGSDWPEFSTKHLKINFRETHVTR